MESQKDNIPIITEVPATEATVFSKLIKTHRKKHIRTSQEIADKVFAENLTYLDAIQDKKVSKSLSELRELAWNEYLKDEVRFNIILIQDLHTILKTPKQILNAVVREELTTLGKNEILTEVKRTCGEYAGKVFPYIYQIALSNTNSRRSRAGKTFESIIYKVYDTLQYSFDSQGQVGRKIFADLGLGKK